MSSLGSGQKHCLQSHHKLRLISYVFSKFKLYSLDGQSFVYKCDYTKCQKNCTKTIFQ
jgi:hypothetical protein